MGQYEGQTVQELKKVLKDRKLTVTGRKAELIARLESYDAALATKVDAKDSAQAEHKTDVPAGACVAAAGQALQDDSAPPHNTHISL